MVALKFGTRRPDSAGGLRLCVCAVRSSWSDSRRYAGGRAQGTTRTYSRLPLWTFCVCQWKRWVWVQLRNIDRLTCNLVLRHARLICILVSSQMSFSFSTSLFQLIRKDVWPTLTLRIKSFARQEEMVYLFIFLMYSLFKDFFKTFFCLI